MEKNLKIHYAAVSISFLFTALILNHFLKINPFEADSFSYLHFGESRTAGYPVFLKILFGIFNSTYFITLSQLVIFSYSGFYLALSIDKIIQKNGWGFFILASLFLNPYWFSFHFKILTESLSSSLLCLFLGSIINYFATKKVIYLYLISIFIGTGILIRPINYTWILGAFFILFYSIFFENNIGMMKRIFILFTPLVLLLFIGSSIYYAKYGSFKTQSFLGNNLIGKAALFADKSVISKEPKFIKALENISKNYIAPLESTNYIQNYYYIGSNIYDVFRYTYLEKIKKEYGIVENVNDDFLAERSFEIIKSHKWLYAKDCLINLASLWLLLDFKSYSEKAELSQIIQKIPREYGSHVSSILQVSKSWPPIIVWSLRTIMIILFLLSIIFLMLPFILLLLKKYQISQVVIIASIAALIIHASFCITAFLQAGLPRYSFALWPCLSVIIAVFGSVLLKVFNKLKFWRLENDSKYSSTNSLL